MADPTNPGLIQLPQTTVQSAAPIVSGVVSTPVAAPSPLPSDQPSAPSVPIPPAPVAPIASYTPATATGVTAGATGYTPTPYAVDKPTGTVAGQLEGLLKADSSYLRAAELPAQQAMNARGLLNSSIAVGAAEQARIAAALPIAQADAGAYNTAMTNTVNAQNAASAQAATASNNASITNAQLLTSLNSTNANAVNSALNAETQASNQRALQVISSNTQTALAGLQSQNQQLLQANVNAANMFSQAVQAIANITTNTNLDANAKSNAILSQLNLLNQGLKTTSAISATNQSAINSLNLGEFFSSPTLIAGGGSTPKYAGARGQYYDTQEQANQSFVQQGVEEAEARAGTIGTQTANA